MRLNNIYAIFLLVCCGELHSPKADFRGTVFMRIANWQKVEEQQASTVFCYRAAKEKVKTGNNFFQTVHRNSDLKLSGLIQHHWLQRNHPVDQVLSQKCFSAL